MSASWPVICSRFTDLGYTVREARVIATTVLVLAGLYLVYGIEGGGLRRRTAVGTMCFVLLGVYVMAILLPSTRRFFELVVPDLGMVITAVDGALLAIVALFLRGSRRSRTSTRRQIQPHQNGGFSSPAPRVMLGLSALALYPAVTVLTTPRDRPLGAGES